MFKDTSIDLIWRKGLTNIKEARKLGAKFIGIQGAVGLQQDQTLKYSNQVNQ